jgi:hypothetical protein
VVVRALIVWCALLVLAIELLADYNVAAGRIWVLVLVTTMLAPLLTAYMRQLPGVQ